MKYGIVNNNLNVVAEFTNEEQRDECFKFVFDVFYEGQYARVKVDKNNTPMNANTEEKK